MLFCLQDEEHICRYRIVQEGLPLLLPHVTRQLLQLTVAELLHLVEDRSVWVPEEACIASSKPAQADGETEVLFIKPNPPVLCSLSCITEGVFATYTGMLHASEHYMLDRYSYCIDNVLVYKRSSGHEVMQGSKSALLLRHRSSDIPLRTQTRWSRSET